MTFLTLSPYPKVSWLEREEGGPGKICLSLGDGLLGRLCEFLDGLLVVS